MVTFPRSSGAIGVFRSEDDAFTDLPGWSHPAAYRVRDGIRLAHVDVGEGPPVLLVHGQPTWGYLWRRVLDELVARGLRCVVPDHAGFGRSDKPLDISWYSYARHADNLAALLDDLDLRDVTLVVHDWGGPIGLRVAVDQPHRIRKMVLMDTGLVTGHQRMSETWLAFRAFVGSTDVLPVGELVAAGCRRHVPDEVKAAYDAPFADPAGQAGVRAFPELVPQHPGAPGAAENRRIQEMLARDARPKLVLWGEHDPVFPVATGRRIAERLGARLDEVVLGAGHFLQEDAGDQVGRSIAGWLDSHGPRG
ncbi:haloalkane dehalogenase [Svornostia abyssi]|uniref:Haloalkane dehalogenase n=1 Tax=Svornostia abyssi TaxID=2898438 RepID=A0ABY5PAW2_9ACTN|nr:haloalkane dehalogenase [Parviterribacteraceae bacterium J379]